MNFTWDEKDYTLRMINLFDHGLCARKQETLNRRVQKTTTAFEQLAPKLNRYKLKGQPAIEKACAGILKKNHTEAFFTYRVVNTPEEIRTNRRRGRPSKKNPPEYTITFQDKFHVELQFDEKAFEREYSKCGYYPLLTNLPPERLDIQDAMLAHKKQYKNEHTFRRAKGPLNIEPVYLQTPKRIEAYLLLFKIALQMVVLIERTARTNIAERDRGLDGFMPNRKDVRNPRSEYMLKEFEYIVQGQMPLPDGQTYGFVSELTELQRDLLSILEVPEYCYDYNYLHDSS